MMSDEQLVEKIILPAYKKMYLEAAPKADLQKLIDSKETLKPNWFMKYYLPQARQDEIATEFIEKYKLGKSERRKVEIELALGSAPNGYRKGEDMG